MKCPLFTEKLAPLHRYERGVIIWNAVVQGDGGWNQASTRQSGTRSGQTDRRDTCGRIHSILCTMQNQKSKTLFRVPSA